MLQAAAALPLIGPRGALLLPRTGQLREVVDRAAEGLERLIVACVQGVEVAMPLQRSLLGLAEVSSCEV